MCFSAISQRQSLSISENHRFGAPCRYKHCSSNDRTVSDRSVAQQSAHNPYTPAPTFSQRRYQKSIDHSHYHNQSEVPSTNESDSGTVPVPFAKHTGPDAPNDNLCSPQDTSGDESDHSNGKSSEESNREWVTITHTLLGGVEELVSGPSGPPVKGQENTALLSDCGLTGTPLRVSLSGLGGKKCSVCVHSVDVDNQKVCRMT